MRFTLPRLALLAQLLGGASLAFFALRPGPGGEETAQACPPGYITKAERERLERREQLAQGEAAREAERGFRSASAARAGRGVRFAFSRREANPVTVDVFQQSLG